MSIMQECSLCYEAFGPSVKPMALPCGHVFCEEDVDRISQTNMYNKCPTCRQPFSRGDGRRLFLNLEPTKKPISPISDSQMTPRAMNQALGALQIQLKASKIVDDKTARRVVAQMEGILGCLTPTSEPGERYPSYSPFYKANREVSDLRLKVNELATAYSDSRLRQRDAERELTSLKKQLLETQDELKSMTASRNKKTHMTSLFESAVAGSPSRCDGFNWQGLAGANLLCMRSPVLIKSRLNMPHNTNRYIPEDLTVDRDDTIFLVNKKAGVWWFGEINGRFGCIPDRCVVFPTTFTTSRPRVRAIRSHNENGAIVEDLQIKKGAVIRLCFKTVGAWWIGIKDGVVGYVPNEKLRISNSLRRAGTI